MAIIEEGDREMRDESDENGERREMRAMRDDREERMVTKERSITGEETECGAIEGSKMTVKES